MGLKQQFYKVRKLTTNNATGDAYGITIPESVAIKHQGVAFSVSESGCGILLVPRHLR